MTQSGRSTKTRAFMAVALAALCLAPPTRAQSLGTVSVDDVRVSGGSRHTLTVSALDASGSPVPDLENGFRVTVDGRLAEDLIARPARAVRPDATVLLVADAALFGSASIDDLRSAVKDLAGSLPPGDRLRVISAGASARTREATAKQGEKLAEGLGSLQDSAAPLLYDALADAVREASRYPARRGAVVLVLSRGVDGGRRRALLDVIALASGGRQTPVYVVLLGDEGASPEAERLRRLAANAGGAFTRATSTYGLGPTLAALAHRGLDTWIVKFSVPGWERSAPRHRISLVVEQGGSHRSADREYDTASALPVPWWASPLLWLALVALALVAAALFFLSRRHQMGLLVHDEDDWDGVWYELFGYPVTIGAAAGNDLVLKEPQVSRNHAILERRGRIVELADLNSENGTFVNGDRISRRALADGDRVSFGPAVHLIYEARG